MLPNGPLGGAYSDSITNLIKATVPTEELTSIADLSIHHKIVAPGLPVFSRPPRLTREHLKAGKKEFNILVKHGIILPSSSPWANPLHLEPKGPGKWQITGDYYQLNAHTRPDRYLLPIIKDLLQDVNGSVFTVIDLEKTFHQIFRVLDDICKTTVTTPLGLLSSLASRLV